MLIERKDAVAVLHMRAGKANAMSADMLVDLAGLVEQVTRSDARALVITGEGSAFSAGLALPTLVDLDRNGARRFIDLFANVMLRVFQCEIPVVAAVNGHAIAGGCVLALMADVRLMVDTPSAKIGLNEVHLGIGLPAVVVEPLRLAVPGPSLTAIAVEGRLFAPSEALRVGLVDDLVVASDLLGRALARAQALSTAPRAGIAQVKAALRRPALDAINARSVEERERWLDTWFSDDGQARLRQAVARITKS